MFVCCEAAFPVAGSVWPLPVSSGPQGMDSSLPLGEQFDFSFLLFSSKKKKGLWICQQTLLFITHFIFKHTHPRTHAHTHNHKYQKCQIEWNPIDLKKLNKKEKKREHFILSLSVLQRKTKTTISHITWDSCWLYFTPAG